MLTPGRPAPVVVGSADVCFYVLTDGRGPDQCDHSDHVDHYDHIDQSDMYLINQKCKSDVFLTGFVCLS